MFIDEVINEAQKTGKYIIKKGDIRYYEPRIYYNSDGLPYLKYEDENQKLIYLLDRKDYVIPYWRIYDRLVY